MTPTLLMFFLLAIAGHSRASWCTCKSSASTSDLQRALDYACGHGADCNAIRDSGSCYQPNTVLEHCNYAVNSYFQKNPQQATACDFAGVATITNTDPSKNTCKYPLAGSSTSTTMTPPTTGMGTGTGTSTGTGPFVTPSTGGSITGTTGMGPTTDLSDGGARLTRTILLCSSIGLVFASLVFW